MKIKYIFLFLLLAILNIHSKPDFKILDGIKKINAYCYRVIDGDTIKVIIKGNVFNVRFLGVDAPELKNRVQKIEHYSKESRLFTFKMLNNKSILLIFGDPEYNENRIDKYDRLLAYVYLENGTFFNELMIKEGYAYVYKKFSFRYMDEFIKIEQEARENKIGLWNY